MFLFLVVGVKILFVVLAETETATGVSVETGSGVEVGIEVGRGEASDASGEVKSNRSESFLPERLLLAGFTGLLTTGEGVGAEAGAETGAGGAEEVELSLTD